ncbi:hypothetical protein NLR23_24850, partial [Escherichia coli]|nr:hypothetical protein [Escherichia coli]
IRIVQHALEAPLRAIVANAGEEPSVVIAKVAEGKGNYGYNAATGEYGDLVEAGVVDPTKVTRTALQNAASVAGLILTTDATIAEAPKEDKPRKCRPLSWTTEPRSCAAIDWPVRRPVQLHSGAASSRCGAGFLRFD